MVKRGDGVVQNSPRLSALSQAFLLTWIVLLAWAIVGLVSRPLFVGLISISQKFYENLNSPDIKFFRRIIMFWRGNGYLVDLQPKMRKRTAPPSKSAVEEEEEEEETLMEEGTEGKAPAAKRARKGEEAEAEIEGQRAERAFHVSAAADRLLDRVTRMQQEDGESEDDNEAAEMPEQRQRSEEGEAGIIEKIKLENFMCHRHLELKLGPNINFIIGVNGST